MKKAGLFYFVVAVAFLTMTALPVVSHSEEGESQKNREYFETQGIHIDYGDAVAGRQAFNDFYCVRCHSVYFDKELPAPVTEVGAPVLGRPDRLHLPAEIIDSIISPSHKISEDFAGELKGDGVSPMADLTHMMTVRALLDITAYLMEVQDL